MSLFNELRRRNVLRVGAAYIVTAWLVIQVVETIFPAFGFGDVAVRYVTIAFAVGLLPALVVAWVFELTPEGLKKDAEVDHDRAFVADSAKRLDRIILLVLALALGYFAFDKFILAPQQLAEEVAEAREAGRSDALVESYGDASIAVLAFENMSPDPDQEYFANGISEEILNLLAGIPELRVISRSSAFTYKGKDLPVPQIARELKVAHILEGSVRKAGNQIRVTAQLIDGRTDTHLWSQTWDRTMDDIFAIQDEVAADVVAELQLKLTGAVPTSPRTDPEVYALTLQAKQVMQFYEEGWKERVEDLLNQALALDPEYVPAMENLLWLSFQNNPEAEFEALYEDLRGRILALDPDNGTIGSWDAWALFEEGGDLEGAARTYQRLLVKHPNDAEVLRVSSAFLRRIGKFEEAIPIAQQCMRIDPLKVNCFWQLKEIHLCAGNLELAREYMERLRTLWDNPIRSHDVLLLLLLGDIDTALAVVESWPRTWQTSAFLAMAAHARGERETFERERALFLGAEQVLRGHPHALQWGATMDGYAGNLDAAFDWLGRLAAADASYAMTHVLEPGLQPLHGDPRWQVFRERVDMDAARLDAIKFTVPAHIPPAEPRLGLD